MLDHLDPPSDDRQTLSRWQSTQIGPAEMQYSSTSLGVQLVYTELGSIGRISERSSQLRRSTWLMRSKVELDRRRKRGEM